MSRGFAFAPDACEHVMEQVAGTWRERVALAWGRGAVTMALAVVVVVLVVLVLK